MGRVPCCDKDSVKRGTWSPEEDAKLKSYIQQHGNGGNWIALPQKIGLKRCGKSCRLRWLNYLRPNLKHGGFSREEENTICRLYISIGSRWSAIAAQLPGRTDNDIKNYWNTRLKKKLFGDQPQDDRTISFNKQESKRYSVDHHHCDLGVINTGAAAASRKEESCREPHHGANLESSSPPLFVVISSSKLLRPVDCGQDLASSSQGISESSADSAVELDELFQFGMVSIGGLDCLYGELADGREMGLASPTSEEPEKPSTG